MACPKPLYQENFKLRSGENTCLATQSMVPGLAASASPSVCVFVLAVLGLRTLPVGLLQLQCVWAVLCCSAWACRCKWVLVVDTVARVQASVVAARRLRRWGTRASLLPACGLFLDLGSNPALAGGFVSTEPPGRPCRSFRKIDSQTLQDLSKHSLNFNRVPGDS